MSAVFRGFQSLVENGPDAVLLVGKAGEVLYSSLANTELSGYTPSELVGRDCLDLIHPEDREDSSRLLNEVIVEPSGPRRWEARLRHKDGNYCWVETTASNLLHDLEVQAIVIHQRDINHRRAAEEKRRLQAEEMTRFNLRMEEFAYTVAHDLREPLRAISAYSEILLKSVQLNPEAMQMAEFVVEGAGRMSTLIQDLLSFARTGMHAPPSMVDLRQVVEKALKNLSLEIHESGSTVTLASLPTVCADETHLVILFQNLISNAIKYRGKGPSAIKVSAVQDATNWVVEVKDNGVGIAPQYQASVFMPFVRLVSRDIPGTGLGLAVCKKIVEGMGGRIWVESEPGLGSTFSFSIPADAGGPALSIADSGLKYAETT